MTHLRICFHASVFILFNLLRMKPGHHIHNPCFSLRRLLFAQILSVCLFRGHITIVPACSSSTLTNVLPHRNAMPQTQDMTPHPARDTKPTCRCHGDFH